MHFLLDVERRCLDDQVRPVLFVLPPPHQLRVQIAIAPLIGNLDRVLLVLMHHRLKLSRGDVLARRGGVGECCDGLLRFLGFSRHRIVSSV